MKKIHIQSLSLTLIVVLSANILANSIMGPFIPVSSTSVETDTPKWTPTFWAFVTFGQVPSFVDYLWMKAIQAGGEKEKPKESTLQSIADDIHLALDLDPHFYELYETSGTLFTVLFNDPKRGATFLDRGIQHFETKKVPTLFWTHPYSLYLYSAYLQGFEFQNWGRARRDFLRAAELPGSPPYLQSMKSWLMKETGTQQLAVRILKILIATNTDPRMVEKFKVQLSQLQVSSLMPKNEEVKK